MTTGGSKVGEIDVLSGGQGYGDYGIFVRHFISDDKPHLPLPYNTITANKTISSNLGHNQMINSYNISTDLTGTYGIGLLLRLVSSSPFMNKADLGVDYRFYVGDLRRYFVQKSLNAKFIQPIFDGTNYLLHHYYQPYIPLPFTSNPDFTIFNASGATLAVYLTVLALDVSI